MEVDVDVEDEEEGGMVLCVIRVVLPNILMEVKQAPAIDFLGA